MADTSREAVERMAGWCARDADMNRAGLMTFYHNVAATLRALMDERDAARDQNVFTDALTVDGWAQANALRKERDAAYALLDEAASDLTAYIDAEYERTTHYPCQKRKKDRDMDLVRRINNLLNRGTDL